MSIISYFYLNEINSPIQMLNLLIKIICCNTNIQDKDMVYEPDNVSVPFDDVEKVGNAVENIVEDLIVPENKIVKKMVSWFDNKKELNNSFINVILLFNFKVSVSFQNG